MTSIGPIAVRRAYFSCPGCGLGEYPADRRIGLEGGISRQGRRLICWFGGRHSFAEAAASLQESGGWTVSDETIRQALLRLGVGWKRAKTWITSPDPSYLRKKGRATG